MDARRRLGVAVVVVAGLTAAVGCGGDSGGTTATTGARASSTTTPEPTTTTTSAEDAALRELAGFSTREAAAFRLFVEPPRPPGPLAALPPPADPPGPVLTIARVDPSGQVLMQGGQPVLAEVRFDRFGRLLANEAGVVVDNLGNPVPSDAEGPILVAVQLDEAGRVGRDAEGRVRLERHRLPSANRVLVVGDSVILGAEAPLRADLVGWQTIVEARESRLPGEGDDVVRAHGDIGRVVVMMLGHNVGPGESHLANIQAMQEVLDGIEIVDRVIWVSAAEIGEGQLEWNEALRGFVSDRREADGDPGVHLVDWALHNAANPDYTDDGLHLTGAGRNALAELLVSFVGPAPDCAIVIGSGPRAGECV